MLGETRKGTKVELGNDGAVRGTGGMQPRLVERLVYSNQFGNRYPAQEMGPCQTGRNVCTPISFLLFWQIVLTATDWSKNNYTFKIIIVIVY